MKIRKAMTDAVCACSPTDTLNRAAQLMWDGDYGALPVVDDGHHVVGVITDRDICMGAYTRGMHLSDLTVSSVMSKEPFTCWPEDDVGDVERLMREQQIRRVPVVDGSGRLTGIVTVGDLARVSQSSPFRRARGGRAIAKTLASICEPRSQR